jgi:flagella basal body P-ring formation protein FlgA
MKQRILKAILGVSVVLLATPAFAASVTANSTLTRGTQITASDIDIKTDDAGEYEALKQKYVGMAVTRTIANGAVIRDRDIAAPIQVRRNSRVKMIYKVGRLEITATGRAMAQGREGDIIPVMNMESRQSVEGRVTGMGTVEMMP